MSGSEFKLLLLPIILLAGAHFVAAVVPVLLTVTLLYMTHRLRKLELSYTLPMLLYFIVLLEPNSIKLLFMYNAYAEVLAVFVPVNVT